MLGGFGYYSPPPESSKFPTKTTYVTVAHCWSCGRFVSATRTDYVREGKDLGYALNYRCVRCGVLYNRSSDYYWRPVIAGPPPEHSSPG